MRNLQSAIRNPRGSLVFMLLAVGSLIGFAGCGGGVKPVKVHGIVTLDGQPLIGANVTFIPKAEKGRLASGITDEQGKFQLTTYQEKDGALPGDYRVVVKLDPEGAYVGPGKEEGAERYQKRFDIMGRKERTPQGKAKVAAERKKLPPSAVPAKYSDPKNTPLSQVVPPSGTVQLELKTKS